jgi:hypothetical protein
MHVFLFTAILLFSIIIVNFSFGNGMLNIMILFFGEFMFDDGSWARYNDCFLDVSLMRFLSYAVNY